MVEDVISALESAHYADEGSEVDESELPGYGVDTGTGCFMDAIAAREFARRLQADLVEHHTGF